MEKYFGNTYKSVIEDPTQTRNIMKVVVSSLLLFSGIILVFMGMTDIGQWFIGPVIGYWLA